MWKHGLFNNVLTTAGFLLASNLFASQLMPISYSMNNGDSHSFKTFHDDTYNGSGSPATDTSFLSGGLGQLTDGLFGNDNFLDTGCGGGSLVSYCWVGWVNTNPVTITFNFGAVQVLSQVNVHGSDWNTDQIQFWDTAVYTFSNDGVNFGNTITRDTVAGDHIPVAGDPQHNTAHFINQAVNQTAQYVQIQLSPTFNTGNNSGRFIFVDEVQFFGPDAVGVQNPEPATITMLAGGLLAGLYFRRRNG
jgi:hypothetical protein